MKLFTGIFLALLHFSQGTAIENQQNPAVVTIINNSGNNTCIGTLISSEWVLTSAVCAMRGFHEEIRVLFFNTYTFNTAGQIENIYIHPGFSSQTRTNDIALMNLATTADLSIRVLRIPTSQIAAEAQRASVISWDTRWTGANDPGTDTNVTDYDIQIPMYSRNVVILNNNLCERYPVYLNEERLCASPNIACEGDEGAPLIVGDQVIGLVSVSAVQAALCEGSCGCNNLFQVTTFTSTVSHRDWIKQVTTLNIL